MHRTLALIAAVPILATLGSTVDLHAQVPDSTALADSLAALDSLLADSLFSDSLGTLDSVPPRPPLPDDVVMHLTHLTTAFFDTPEGVGIIPVGMAEASIAAEFVRIAGQDSTDLENMTGNMSHVIHAIDPNEVRTGLGLGYGFRRAAENVAMHIEFAMAVEGVSMTVQFHGPFIAQAARGAIGRADEAVAMARRVERAEDVETALPLIERLADLVRAMAYGDDRERDGRIGRTESEAGLAQATYHLNLIYRVEGLEFPVEEVPDSIGTPSRGASR